MLSNEVLAAIFGVVNAIINLVTLMYVHHVHADLHGKPN
jgi:hypothetical protein